MGSNPILPVSLPFWTIAVRFLSTQILSLLFPLRHSFPRRPFPRSSLLGHRRGLQLVDPLRFALLVRRAFSFLDGAARAGSSVAVALPPRHGHWVPRLRRLGFLPLSHPTPAGFLTNHRSFSRSSPLPSLLLLLDPDAAHLLAGEAALLRIPSLGAVPATMVPSALLYPIPVDCLSPSLLLRFLALRGSPLLSPPRPYRRHSPAPPFVPLLSPRR